MTVKNTSAKPQAVKVVEPIPGSWEITKETHSHTKSDAGTAQWDFQIPPKSQVVLEYTAKSTLGQ